MSSQQPIHVIVHRNGSILTASTTPELESMDFVEWTFQDVETNESVHIEFANPPFGPLQSRITDRNRILGLGNTGQPGEFLYTATIHDDESNVVASGQATILNLSTEVNSSPVATVNFPNNSPQVSPASLQVAVDGNATWHLIDVPEDHTVQLVFNPVEGFPPFHSFAINPGPNGTQIAEAMKLDNHGQEQVTYTVLLLDPSNVIVGSHDPVIEPLGWPPPDSKAP